jgi:hypothetical protein
MRRAISTPHAMVLDLLFVSIFTEYQSSSGTKSMFKLLISLHFLELDLGAI